MKLAIALVVLGIGAVPGGLEQFFAAGKVFSHMSACAGNMALAKLFPGPDPLLLVDNLQG